MRQDHLDRGSIKVAADTMCPDELRRNFPNWELSGIPMFVFLTEHWGRLWLHIQRDWAPASLNSSFFDLVFSRSSRCSETAIDGNLGQPTNRMRDRKFAESSGLATFPCGGAPVATVRDA